MMTMRAAAFAAPGTPLRVSQHDVRTPSPGEVRVRVAYCGLCYDDTCLLHGRHPSSDRELRYPRVPGHEVVGVVEALGPETPSWWSGRRVGIGPHGGHCHVCAACRNGDFSMCAHRVLTGIDCDGGLAECAIARVESLVRLPEDIPLCDAAPLLCAGAAAFATLRAANLSPGDRIAIQGIGGFGHILIQSAAGMGLDVIAISRASAKKEFAASLGARTYIDASTQRAARSLAATGGVSAIVCTAPDNEFIADLLSGLQPEGKLVLLGGAPGVLRINPMELVGARRIVSGILNCTPAQTEAGLRYFSVARVRAHARLFELEEAAAFSTLITRPDYRRVVVKVASGTFD